MTDERRTTVVARTTEVVVATAWRDFLRSEGIVAELLGGGGADGGVGMFSTVYPSMEEYRVIVFEDDAARAREVIARAEAGELSLPDGE